MISLGLGTVVAGNGSSFGGFSAEYAAVLANGTSRGATLPSGSQQAKQNQLIVDLKTDGIWDKLDAFYMLATDGNSAFALINWKNPSANYGTAVNSLPTFTTNQGFTGSGSNAINLNFAANSGTNFKDPNSSIGVFVGTAVYGPATPFMGADNAKNRLWQSSAGNLQSCQLSGSSYDGAVVANNNMSHINVNSTNARLFLNGSVSGGGYKGAWYTDTTNFHLFRTANGTVYNSSQIKMAFIGGDLAAQASSFYGTMNTYYNNL